MVFIRSFLGVVALAASVVLGAPTNMQMGDSAIGDEVGVSAPNGTPITDTAELQSQRSAEAMTKTMAPMMTSSSMMMEATSTAMMKDDNKKMMMMSSSSSSSAAYATATYGSGSSNWGSDYNSCVQQCVAQFGSPDNTYTAKPTATMGSSGNGATHTVIVAPSQGVLRYVPAMVNATVGDTIMFKWQANNHTVTKGSSLELCNKTSDAPFASGLQQKDFVFTQVVNDTNPVFFYCAAPGHCQKGMFGVINMGTTSNSGKSAAGMMGSLLAASPALQAMDAMVQSQTANGTKNVAAARWGGNTDMSQVPAWAQPFMAENIQYTRAVMAMNPDVITEDGKVDLSRAATPIMWPEDLAAAMKAASPASDAANNAASAAPASAAAASASSAAPSASPTSNGAGALAPSAFMALAAVAVTVFAL